MTRVSPKGRLEGERRSAKHGGSTFCILLLFVLVACALSLVTSRHQARRVFVELEREQARARQYDVEYGQLSLEQSTWGMNHRGETRELAQVAQPTIAVITNAQREHQEFMYSLIATVRCSEWSNAM